MEASLLSPLLCMRVLLVPGGFAMRTAELKEMVTQVNASEVASEDKLTDNVSYPIMLA